MKSCHNLKLITTVNTFLLYYWLKEFIIKLILFYWLPVNFRYYSLIVIQRSYYVLRSSKLLLILFDPKCWQPVPPQQFKILAPLNIDISLSPAYVCIGRTVIVLNYPWALSSPVSPLQCPPYYFDFHCVCIIDDDSFGSHNLPELDPREIEPIQCADEWLAGVYC